MNLLKHSNSRDTLSDQDGGLSSSQPPELDRETFLEHLLSKASEAQPDFRPPELPLFPIKISVRDVTNFLAEMEESNCGLL